MQIRPLTLIAAGAIAVGAALGATGAGAADHLDAPAVQEDGRTDINDLYAFQSTENKNRTVLVMTVNPLSGVMSGDTFHPDAEYVFHIDQDGDAVADAKAVVTFDEATASGQDYTVAIDGRRVASGSVGEASPVRGSGRVVAGQFEDPFFFDLAGFRNGLNFTGDDTLAGADVSAIVLEVHNKWVGDTVGIWATTSINGSQIDRMGRPAINTVLIPSGEKDAYNQASPADDDAEYTDEITATVEALSGDADYAADIGDLLTPDVLGYTTGTTADYRELNGRALADDVIDFSLLVVTNGGLTSDGVDANDASFLDEFPYLAPANA